MGRALLFLLIAAAVLPYQGVESRSFFTFLLQFFYNIITGQPFPGTVTTTRPPTTTTGTTSTTRPTTTSTTTRPTTTTPTTTRPTTTTPTTTTTTTRPTTTSTTTTPTTTTSTTRPTTTTTPTTTSTTTTPTTTSTTTTPTTTSTTTTPTTTSTTTTSTTSSTTTPSPRICSPCGVGPRTFQSRIVNGADSRPGDWPWQAAIVNTSRITPSEPIDISAVFCGGSLICNNVVLTAAHCTDGLGPSNILVRLGETDFRIITESQTVDINVSEIRQHPGYVKATYDNDIALLKLATPARLGTNPSIGLVCLPPPDASYDGLNFIVSGWGLTSENGSPSETLKDVVVPSVPQATCQVSYSTLTNNMVCAGGNGPDSCRGDSGGPLVGKNATGPWVLYGVVSFGIVCGREPGVYAKVTNYLTWIYANW